MNLFAGVKQFQHTYDEYRNWKLVPCSVVSLLV